MKAKIYVTPKKSVLDPQGVTVQNALHSLGYSSVNNVRVGKFIELDINTTNKADAEKAVRQFSHDLLSNPVIEDFHYELEG